MLGCFGILTFMSLSRNVAFVFPEGLSTWCYWDEECSLDCIVCVLASTSLVYNISSAWRGSLQEPEWHLDTKNISFHQLHVMSHGHAGLLEEASYSIPLSHSMCPSVGGKCYVLSNAKSGLIMTIRVCLHLYAELEVGIQTLPFWGWNRFSADNKTQAME